MTVLVTGARGQVGRGVVRRLHAAGLPVRAASARPGELSVPAGVESVELALGRPETFAAALSGVRQVFLYPEPSGVDAFVGAARAAGVEHVVLLSSAAVLSEAAAEDPLGSHNLRVEQALLASGLSCTLLRADSFASNALAWAHPIGRGLPIELPYPEAALAVVHPEDLAELAFAALTGREPRGRAVTVTGGESLTLRRQLAVLAEVLGREIPVETIGRAAAAEQLGRHMPAAFVESLLTYWAAASGGAPAALGDTTRTLLGRPERTFRQWAVEHAGEFAAHRPGPPAQPRAGITSAP